MIRWVGVILVKELSKERGSRSRAWPNNRPGLTLIELLVVFGITTLTIVGAVVFHKRSSSRLGWLLGGFLGFLVIPATAAIWALFEGLVWGGIPTFPCCRNGHCRRERDYELKSFGEEFDWECKCGDRYKRYERRFMQVTDEGEKIPYKVWRPFRGWFPDEERLGDRHQDIKAK